MLTLAVIPNTYVGRTYTTWQPTRARPEVEWVEDRQFAGEGDGASCQKAIGEGGAVTLNQFYSSNKAVLDSYVSQAWPSCCYAMLFGSPSDEDPTEVSLFLGFPDDYPNLPSVRWGVSGRPVADARLRVFKFGSATLDSPPHDLIPDAHFAGSCYKNGEYVEVPASGNDPATRTKILSSLAA
ncbi:MAG TPA: hypothetical protein VJY33_09135 [Isosphaeraceae bacterium]|nr:hypothetical protein [Isosphaeraceae bacterium]